MRKIKAATFVSLDGVMQAPGGPKEDPSGGFAYGGWMFHYADETTGKVVGETFDKPFDLLLGRRTYDRGRVINDHGHVERESSRSKTLELEIEIPIYDFGQSKVALAEQTYMQAANKLAEKAVNIRSEAREAYTAYRANYDITRQYQNNVLPLRKIIQDESLLQYSGMLNDVTDLITDARNRILSNVAAINARRDFWIAHTDFKHALIGGGSGGGGATVTAAAAGGDAAGGH